MNNYWTRAASVALVYFSEIKRDESYSDMPRFYRLTINKSHPEVHTPK